MLSKAAHLKADITFVNGESTCGCVMEYDDGEGEYSSVLQIWLCPKHREKPKDNTA